MGHKLYKIKCIFEGFSLSFKVIGICVDAPPKTRNRIFSSPLENALVSLCYWCHYFLVETSYVFLYNVFSSVQSISHVRFFATPWTAAHQASLAITNSQSLLKLMSKESVMPSNHLILCHPLLLPPSIIPRIKVFSNESVLLIRWPKYWSFNINISPSNEHSGLIFRIDWLDLCSPRDSQESSPIPQFKSINSLVLSFLYSPTLTSIHDYWKNHSFH